MAENNSHDLTFNSAACYPKWSNILHRPDAMAQWQDCRPEYREAWGPEFNPRLGLAGVRFLYKLGQPSKTFISFSLLSVAQWERLLWRVLYSFHISVHAICFVCIYRKLFSFYIWATLYKWKGVANPLKKNFLKMNTAEDLTFNFAHYSYIPCHPKWSRILHMTRPLILLPDSRNGSFSFNMKWPSIDLFSSGGYANLTLFN